MGSAMRDELELGPTSDRINRYQYKSKTIPRLALGVSVN